MLLRDLTIENFRSFDKYQLNGLARVNLLVGDNNCGKTSVLEAAFFVTTSRPHEAVFELARLRDETCAIEPSSSQSEARTVPSVENLFHGRILQPRQKLSIRGAATLDGLDTVLSFTAQIEDFSRFREEIISKGGSLPLKAEWRLNVNWKSGENSRTRRVLMTTDGAVYDHFWSGSDGVELGPTPPEIIESQSEYLPLIGWNAQETARRWDRIIEAGRKQRVVELISLIHSDLKDVVFLPGRIGVSQRSGGILFEFSSDPKPVQLSSLGDGSQRLLSIAISLNSLHRGVALIDEIDTGLHYSRLKDMWRMVIKTAKELDVQVFATTHSLDCIRGLDEAIQDDESLASDVALFTIDRRMEQAVRFAGDELRVVVDHEIEVR